MALDTVITIDGPVASGKTTVGKKIADQLEFNFLDTGVMYRAVTLAVLEKGIDPEDESAVGDVAERINIEVLPASKDDGRQYDVIVDGQDATWNIREKRVVGNVSLVSTYERVRTAMTQKQREIGLRGMIVMVGRDIGTVVLPDASYKYFLVASVEERAKRRFLEQKNSGKDVQLEDLIQSLKDRDEIDSSRAIAPLKPAEDAVVIDTDGKTADQVVKEIVNNFKGG